MSASTTGFTTPAAATLPSGRCNATPEDSRFGIMANSSDYDLIILGAGVVGVSTAYWASLAGLHVCLLDRHGAAGLETSFANGGQVSVSHAEPWANPSAPLKVLQWLFDDKAPLLFRPQFDWQQWKWIAGFLRECLPSRTDRNTMQIVQLALDSRQALGEIRAREQLAYDARTEGILHFYTSPADFAAASRAAVLMQRYGCDRRIIGRDEVFAIEPALAQAPVSICGATYTAEDESGDALKYTQGLTEICRNRGVDLRFDTDAIALHPGAGSSIAAVEVRSPQGFRKIRARHIAVCLGSYSAPFLRASGTHLNIYPTKGYSATIPIGGGGACPVVSLTDDEHKIVYSNLNDRLRIAGTAELAGFDLRLNQVRCDALVERARFLFPQAGDFGAAQFWTALRPATPSNLPYVGRTRRYDNLWLNTGHGTLGWTLAAGTGRTMTGMIAGRTSARVVA
jgi:D-amino-acid dehydrogenase